MYTAVAKFRSTKFSTKFSTIAKYSTIRIVLLCICLTQNILFSKIQFFWKLSKNFSVILDLQLYSYTCIRGSDVFNVLVLTLYFRIDIYHDLPRLLLLPRHYYYYRDYFSLQNTRTPNTGAAVQL